MFIQSPLKEKKVRPNVKGKSSARAKKKGNGFARTKNGSNGISYGKKMKPKESKPGFFSALKPWKVILGAVVIGALGVLYLNHVFATQELLKEVQQLEREYNKTRRLHNDFRLTYDRMIGPAAIYEKAKEMGFINGGPAEKVIEIEKE